MQQGSAGQGGTGRPSAYAHRSHSPHRQGEGDRHREIMGRHRTAPLRLPFGQAKGTAEIDDFAAGEPERWLLRHCERSEAIQTGSLDGPWIASLRSQ
ncbi:hypothetical protein [Bosea sp. RAC05]|uniref:hypothetical protein n=1 Tax=Bosea sp. RAC05 TaxID=1842539 RepID=UPI0012372190|nr:hypothetical protein [Bosea sp. RAC05]